MGEFTATSELRLLPSEISHTNGCVIEVAISEPSACVVNLVTTNM